MANTFYIIKKETMEIWKDIKGYEGIYQVSNLGNIKSLSRFMERGKFTHFSKEVIMNGQLDKDGYNVFMLTLNRKQKLLKGHRLVAEAFILNPENKPQVNHINGIKTDNTIKNLEWNTNSENQLHSYKIGTSKKGAEHGRARKVLDLQTGIFYDTIQEAAFTYGINNNNLSRYLNGSRPNKSNLILI